MKVKASDHFSIDDRERIRNAIMHAEDLTSGEIRIYIEDFCKGEVLDRAAFVFAEMNIHKTALRNGVLIYLAMHDHKFAVIGDAGIHAVVGTDFWQSVKDLMAAEFREKRFAEGLIAGIHEAGKVLQQHFPFKGEDQNELPDDIVIK